MEGFVYKQFEGGDNVRNSPSYHEAGAGAPKLIHRITAIV